MRVHDGASAFHPSMIPLFSSTGMSAVTTVVIVAEILSLAAMLVILLIFWATLHRQNALLMTLHDAEPSLKSHIILVGVYIFSTLGIGLVSFGLFLFQPHLI